MIINFLIIIQYSKLNDVEEKLINILLKVSEKDCQQFVMDEILRDEEFDLYINWGMNSLMMIEVLAEMEKVFNIKINLQSLDFFRISKYQYLKEILISNLNNHI